MFLLADPIYWINKTLAVFERMVEKLRKQIEKCEAEIARNKEASEKVRQASDVKADVIESKRFAKVAKIDAKARTQMEILADKTEQTRNDLDARNIALEMAKERAKNASEKINALIS